MALQTGTVAVQVLTLCVMAAASGQSRPDQGYSKIGRGTGAILPAEALDGAAAHPLARQIGSFLESQKTLAGTSPLAQKAPDARDYLRIIEGQVRGFQAHQDGHGAIIDPVEKIEWQYSTPCYALSVALLAATGHNRDPALLESGLRAMDCSVDEMFENRTAHNHGEFFIQPVMLALDLYAGLAAPERLADWTGKLSRLDPYRLYPDNLRVKTPKKQTVYNHNVVAVAGEYLRIKGGLNGDLEFFETHLDYHRPLMSPLGMYRDPKVPIVYDEFSRQFLASILCEGYSGPSAAFYRAALWKGAWTSLFMQSPFGEAPTGGRSAQHIWNEAQSVVTYEIYAAQYARARRPAEAGAFKRAAHLSAQCIRRWLRPDGTGYVVKNRFPPEAHHGYERYSAQSQYNLLACWLLSVAYLYADETVAERPCPADVGGFVVTVEDFHKVFANAGGTYVEYETGGDLHYNPTGLIRCHITGSNPQLGPTDGVVHRFDARTKEDLGGENIAVGPAWRDQAGKWHRLADYSPSWPQVDVLEERPSRVRFRVTYAGAFDGIRRISETTTLEPGTVTVQDALEGEGLDRMRVYFPMLVFDGLEETRVTFEGSGVNLSLRGGGVRYGVVQPAGLELKRTGTRLAFRNGLAEAVYADVPGTEAMVRIEKQ